MFSVPDLLDRAKARAGNANDFHLAKVIGVSHSAVSQYRTGARLPDGRATIALCALSGDDPEHVAACLQAMRAVTADDAALWRRVAARLQKGVAATAMLALLAATMLGAYALPHGALSAALSGAVGPAAIAQSALQPTALRRP